MPSSFIAFECTTCGFCMCVCTCFVAYCMHSRARLHRPARVCVCVHLYIRLCVWYVSNCIQRLYVQYGRAHKCTYICIGRNCCRPTRVHTHTSRACFVFNLHPRYSCSLAFRPPSLHPSNHVHNPFYCILFRLHSFQFIFHINKKKNKITHSAKEGDV